ncbi:MOS1T transposase, partial [Pseudoatta argentina]
MSKFVPDKVFLRGVLLHYFNMNKSAAEAHRILVQTYGDNAPRFKNNDFELEDKERSGAPKKFQDKELEQLLDKKYYKLMSQLFITGDRYRLQLMRLSRALKEKRPLYAQRHDKVILLHDNARPHVAKPVKTKKSSCKKISYPNPIRVFPFRSKHQVSVLMRRRRGKGTKKRIRRVQKNKSYIKNIDVTVASVVARQTRIEKPAQYANRWR